MEVDPISLKLRRPGTSTTYPAFQPGTESHRRAGVRSRTFVIVAVAFHVRKCLERNPSGCFDVDGGVPVSVTVRPVYTDLRWLRLLAFLPSLNGGSGGFVCSPARREARPPDCRSRGSPPKDQAWLRSLQLDVQPVPMFDPIFRTAPIIAIRRPTLPDCHWVRSFYSGSTATYPDCHWVRSRRFRSTAIYPDGHWVRSRRSGLGTDYPDCHWVRSRGSGSRPGAPIRSSWFDGEDFPLWQRTSEEWASIAQKIVREPRLDDASISEVPGILFSCRHARFHASVLLWRYLCLNTWSDFSDKRPRVLLDDDA